MRISQKKNQQKCLELSNPKAREIQEFEETKPEKGSNNKTNRNSLNFKEKIKKVNNISDMLQMLQHKSYLLLSNENLDVVNFSLTKIKVLLESTENNSNGPVIKLNDINASDKSLLNSNLTQRKLLTMIMAGRKKNKTTTSDVCLRCKKKDDNYLIEDIIDWIYCTKCGRWFHINCLSKSDSEKLILLNDSNCDFVCC